MIVRTRIAVNMVLPDRPDCEERDPAEGIVEPGPNWSWTTGPRTKMPQSPITTLGTAASISTSEPTTPRTAGGASSLRKRPIAIESGAASRTRRSDVTYSVPMMKSSAPNSFVTAFQVCPEEAQIPKCRSRAAPADDLPDDQRRSARRRPRAANAVSQRSARSPRRSRIERRDASRPGPTRRG